MESRTFQAREIREALALVRRELGPEAIILSTRRVPGRALGLLGGSFFEVTAAPSESHNPAQTASARSDAREQRDERDHGLLAQRRAQRERERPGRNPLRSLISDDPGTALVAATTSAAVPHHAALRRRLLAAMVPRDLCETWLRAIAPPAQENDPAGRADAEAQLRAHLHQALGPSAGLCTAQHRVVALVGPTGVGKTTTVAKLAAAAHLAQGRKVALISLDDGRIGGTTALRAYARLLGVPISVAPQHGLGQALAHHGDAELVLIDTPGLSPSHPEAFAELGRKLARAGEPVFTHLCVAAATRIEELERIGHLYGAAKPAALLLTKVDEAIAIGSAIALRFRAELPLSFATTGPQVPDDITRANPDFVLDLLLGGVRA